MMGSRRRLFSEDQCARFEAHGWLLLRDVVSSDGIAEFNRAFDKAMAAGPLPPGAGHSGVLQLPDVCRTNKLLLRHLNDGVAELACHLLGTRTVRLLQDALLLKPPAANGSVSLHQDHTYTGFLDPPAVVSVGLALTDACVESGCLYVVDASHKWGFVGDFHIFAEGLQSQRDIGNLLSRSQRQQVDHAKVPLEVRAGDVTMHHCLTFHGSYDNTSRHPRKTVVTHLFSGDCELVRERLPGHAAGRFDTDELGRLRGAAFPELYPRGTLP